MECDLPFPSKSLLLNVSTTAAEKQTKSSLLLSLFLHGSQIIIFKRLLVPGAGQLSGSAWLALWEALGGHLAPQSKQIAACVNMCEHAWVTLHGQAPPRQK